MPIFLIILIMQRERRGERNQLCSASRKNSMKRGGGESSKSLLISTFPSEKGRRKGKNRHRGEEKRGCDRSPILFSYLDRGDALKIVEKERGGGEKKGEEKIVDIPPSGLVKKKEGGNKEGEEHRSALSRSWEERRGVGGREETGRRRGNGFPSVLQHPPR